MTFPPVLSAEFMTGRAAVVGYTVSSCAWDFPEHRHNGFCDLILVCKGSLVNRINRKEIILPAGSLTWVRAADCHAVSGTDIIFYNLNVKEKNLHRLALAIGEEKHFRLLLDEMTAPVVELGEQFISMQDEFANLHRQQFEPTVPLLMNQLLIKVLVTLILPLVQQENRQPDYPEWMHRGMTFFENQLEQGVGLAELIRACGRSSEHVARTFQRILGMSPSAWINHKRLDCAALLLAGTNRDITGICYDLGFNNLSYFYRMFRRYYGLTPRHYRLKTNPFAI